MQLAGRRRDGAGRPAPREGGVRPGQRGVPCRSPRFGGPGVQQLRDDAVSDSDDGSDFDFDAAEEKAKTGFRALNHDGSDRLDELTLPESLCLPEDRMVHPAEMFQDLRLKSKFSLRERARRPEFACF